MLIIWPFELSELCMPGFEPLHRKTRGSYTLQKVKSCLGNQQLDLSKRLNVCTDGAPSVIGTAPQSRRRALVGLGPPNKAPSPPKLQYEIL